MQLPGPVGLFIPCYVDQFYPDVGLATVDLLEGLGLQVEYPEQQTCCGQPMANTGCSEAARPLAQKFVETFAGYSHVVCPSGSCVSMVRNHYEEFFGTQHENQNQNQNPDAQVRTRVYELVEFLTDVLKVEEIPGRFPYRVGLHQSCHGLRELRLGPASELAGTPRVDKARKLLQSLEGLTLVDLQRPDECCGFGGTFAVAEEAVSCMMGRDRLADHEKGGAEILTAGDMSCLMHLDGLIRRDGKPLRVMHIAQILAGRPAPTTP